nr:hypothetical protein asmbl_7 [uncultured bacterium]
MVQSHLTNVEALGCGTLAHDLDTGAVLSHIHTSVGLKERAATGYTSRLLAARVQVAACLCWSEAEGVGFEPTSRVTPASGFQAHRPAGPTPALTCGNAGTRGPRMTPVRSSSVA